MKVRTLMYHDVAPEAELPASGFPGADAGHYKLTAGKFAAHLDAFAKASLAFPQIVTASGALTANAETPKWMITFDDGGSGAIHAAAELEKKNWRGHFLITTSRIGSPGFLSAAQIADLHARGHCIGSHSATHPVPISSLTSAQLDDEWRTSIAALREITGAPVIVASVPGGFHSRAVAESAARAGLQFLFTSEPTARTSHCGAMQVLGRYAIFSKTNARTAAALATGAGGAAIRQSTFWQMKKIAKRVLGPLYLTVRQKWFNRN